MIRPARRPQIRSVPRPLALLALLACLGARAQTATAAQGDVLTATAGVTSMWDDNLFLLPSIATIQPRSDYLIAPYAELKIDKPFSRQVLTVDVLVTDYRYGHYKGLDFVAPKYGAQWRWAFARHFTGTLSANGDKALSSFAYFRSGTSGDVVTTHNERASLDWWIGGGLHVIGSGFLRSVHNSQRFQQVDSNNQHGARIGLKYLTEAGSWITVRFSTSHGDYPTRSLTEQSVYLLDRRFDRKDTELLMHWRIDPQLRLQASAGHLSLTFPDVVARDFSGNYGALRLTWTPLRRLQVELGAHRRLSQWQDDIASYRASDAVFLSPTWTITHTVSLQVSLQRERVSFRGHPLAITPQGLPFRTDHVSTVQVGLDWKPTRNMVITLSGQDSHRDSGPYAEYFIYQYSDRIVSLDANISF